MAKSINNLQIGVIVILGIVLVVGIIYWIVWEKGVSDCEKNESPLCLTGTCPSATSECQLSPFKMVNGKMVCKTSIINYAGGPPKVNAYSANA